MYNPTKYETWVVFNAYDIAGVRFNKFDLIKALGRFKIKW